MREGAARHDQDVPERTLAAQGRAGRHDDEARRVELAVDEQRAAVHARRAAVEGVARELENPGAACGEVQRRVARDRPGDVERPGGCDEEARRPEERDVAVERVGLRGGDEVLGRAEVVADIQAARGQVEGGGGLAEGRSRGDDEDAARPGCLAVEDLERPGLKVGSAVVAVRGGEPQGSPPVFVRLRSRLLSASVEKISRLLPAATSNVTSSKTSNAPPIAFDPLMLRKPVPE